MNKGDMRRGREGEDIGGERGGVRGKREDRMCGEGGVCLTCFHCKLFMIKRQRSVTVAAAVGVNGDGGGEGDGDGAEVSQGTHTCGPPVAIPPYESASTHV